MDSRGGERLSEKTNDQVVNLLYAENLETKFSVSFPYVIAINCAHVFVLF